MDKFGKSRGNAAISLGVSKSKASRKTALSASRRSRVRSTANRHAIRGHAHRYEEDLLTSNLARMDLRHDGQGGGGGGGHTALRTHLLLPSSASTSRRHESGPVSDGDGLELRSLGVSNAWQRWTDGNRSSLMEQIFAWRRPSQRRKTSRPDEEQDNKLIDLAHKELGEHPLLKSITKEGTEKRKSTDERYYVTFSAPFKRSSDKHAFRPRANSANARLATSGRPTNDTGRAVAGLVAALGGMAAATATGGRLESTVPLINKGEGPLERRDEYDAKSLPIDLSSVNRDCFIIPQQFVDRFLPDGFTLPSGKNHRLEADVSVLRVHDPMLSIYFDFFEVPKDINMSTNDHEEPPPNPGLIAKLQKAAVRRFNEVRKENEHNEGYILQNMERDDYPFINYFVMRSNAASESNAKEKQSLSSSSSCSSSSSSSSSSSPFFEVATIARPPIQTETKRPLTKATGFIVCIYKVFKGDNRAKFERNWLFWTGARMLYRTLPKQAGLRRLTLHRSVESSEHPFITYVLIVECTRFMYQVGHIANLLNVLRSRICGYTGIYRILDSFL